jgi:gamma-glutamyltranspeptidase/glutathione hydrolase
MPAASSVSRLLRLAIVLAVGSAAGAERMLAATRPLIMGTHGVVASGHYLASEAGMRILRAGGNAVDAGVAMVFAQAVLEPDEFTVGGEVPILIYGAGERQVRAISGQGVAPARATIEEFRRRGLGAIPGDGFLPAVVPAVVDALALALERYGTLTLGEVLQPAIELAEQGFPVHPQLARSIATIAKKVGAAWPTSEVVFWPGGRAPAPGDLLVQRDLGRTLRTLAEAEAAARGAGRAAAIRAGRDAFYRGALARAVVAFQAEHPVKDATGAVSAGLLAYDDFARYAGRLEEPASASYRDVQVFKTGPWGQGPVLLEQLNLLEGFDLVALGHNSADYVHTVAEAAKLAFADREAYYGDPLFARVPLGGLLSKAYAAERRRAIDRARASLELRPGDPARFDPGGPGGAPPSRIDPAPEARDTTGTRAVDARGNMFSATPSGGWISTSPLVAGAGFALGTRGQMFSLDPSRPNALAPGKRPRTTLTPSLALKGGEPYLAWGSPGGDGQDQWSLQFLLNVVDFGMSLQDAIDAPNFHIRHFPSSFYPHEQKLGLLVVEERIAPAVRAALGRRGHRLQVAGPWSGGQVTAIEFDPRRRVIAGAASSRGDKAYALGW